MNKLFPFLLLCLVLPVCAEDDTILEDQNKPEENIQQDVKENVVDEVEDKVLEDHETDVKYFRVRNAAQISPKKAHNISVNKAYRSLDKEKARLEKLKNKELWLLKDESEVLDYHF